MSVYLVWIGQSDTISMDDKSIIMELEKHAYWSMSYSQAIFDEFSNILDTLGILWEVGVFIILYIYLARLIINSFALHSFIFFLLIIVFPFSILPLIH